MGKRETLTAIFWILLGVTISIWSATFPFGSWEAPGPGFLPLILGLILILLGGILFLQMITGKGQGPAGTFTPIIPRGASFTRVALTLGSMLLTAIFLERLGFFLTVFFLILLLMRSIQPQKWKIALFYSLLTAFSSLILFNVLLKTPLPRGFLGF